MTRVKPNREQPMNCSESHLLQCTSLLAELMKPKKGNKLLKA